MNRMEEFDFINAIYPIYKSLLTPKQQKVMDDYYLFELSLSEISEELKISRNAVLDNIEHSKIKLINFEEKLKIYKKRELILEIIEKSNDKKELKQEIERIFNDAI